MSPRTILVLPVYNESTTLIEVLSGADPYCDLILAVDDGSQDGTRELLAAYALAHPKLFVVSHQTNRGMSGAVLTAFLILREGLEQGTMAFSDIVVTMDADGQHDPGDIPRLTLPICENRADMVLGRRKMERYPAVKRMGNWGLSWWASWWSGRRYYDAECGFRAFSGSLLMDMLLFFNPSQYGLAQEMAVIAARRSWRVTNDVVIGVPRYRAGARPIHGFNNLLSSVRAYYRVRGNRRVGHTPEWDRLVDGTGDLPDCARHALWSVWIEQRPADSHRARLEKRDIYIK